MSNYETSVRSGLAHHYNHFRSFPFLGRSIHLEGDLQTL